MAIVTERWKNAAQDWVEWAVTSMNLSYDSDSSAGQKALSVASRSIASPNLFCEPPSLSY